DRHVLATLLAVVESHAAGRKRKEGVVFAHADVDARVHLGPALTDNDVAADHVLTAELLHAEATAGRVATVAGRTACFLMCHLELPLTSRRRASWPPHPWAPSWRPASSRRYPSRAFRQRSPSSEPRPSSALPWLPQPWGQPSPWAPPSEPRQPERSRPSERLPSSAQPSYRPWRRRPRRCAAASSAGDGRPCGDSCADGAS